MEKKKVNTQLKLVHKMHSFLLVTLYRVLYNNNYKLKYPSTITINKKLSAQILCNSGNTRATRISIETQCSHVKV